MVGVVLTVPGLFTKLYAEVEADRVHVVLIYFENTLLGRVKRPVPMRIERFARATFKRTSFPASHRPRSWWLRHTRPEADRFETNSVESGLGVSPPPRPVERDGRWSPAHCQLTAPMSFAKIGELLHRPFRFFLATANCGNWNR